MCLGWDIQGQLTLTFSKQILHLCTRAVVVDVHFKTQASETLVEGFCVFVRPIPDVHTCANKARSGNRLQSDQVPLVRAPATIPEKQHLSALHLNCTRETRGKLQRTQPPLKVSFLMVLGWPVLAANVT